MEHLRNGDGRIDLEKLQNSTRDQRFILMDAKLDWIINHMMMSEQRKLLSGRSQLKKISKDISAVGLGQLTKFLGALVILIYVLRGGDLENLVAIVSKLM